MSTVLPLSGGDPTWSCPTCAQPISDEILADAPDCPHGWQSLEDLPLADIKATFAAGAPELSLDPRRSA